MELKKMLEKVIAGFVRTKSDGPAQENQVDMFDVAVAEIALMIAALDGTVRPEEFSAYRWIAGRCSGLSEGERHKLLDAAVRKAGCLLMMAQTDAYSESERLAAFDEAVRAVLPNGFADRSQTDVRRSFVLWLAMSVSDGEYSGIERQAVGLLHRSLVTEPPLEADFFETAERLVYELADHDRRSESERDLDRLVVFSR